jgi:hypothetical protein
MRGRLMAALVALAATTGACATAGGAEGGAAGSDRNAISAEAIAEMRAAGATDALTLIERARAAWLRARRDVQTGEPRYPVVYYNGQRMGAPTQLRSVPAERVQSIRYWSPASASARWGPEAEFGIIEVTGH